MSTVVMLGAVVAGIVLLTPQAARLAVPLPVLLTVFGLLVPLVPGTPGLDIEPGLILPVVLPPLLFAATQRSSAREFRDNAGPILLLAVGLTVATAAVAAVVAHHLGLGWGAAWVLGAVVAPPDPVAATAVARRLRLPQRLVTVLEGEGMFNDATALVLYNVAVAAVVTGDLGGLDLAGALGLGVVVGFVVGVVAGMVTRLALKALRDAAAETTVTVAMPFAAYLLAEHLHGSGVLAVLTLGLYLRSYGHPALTSGGWLLGRAVWSFADYLITSLVFVLIGFELTTVLNERIEAGAVRLAAAVTVALVATRFVWMFPAAAAARALQRRRETASPYGVRETAVVAWAGMRGVVTVAAALAVPLRTDAGPGFPERAEIVFVGLACVLVTLVAQGLTLAPLVRRLGVAARGDHAAEVTDLRRRAAEAALETVRAVAPDSDVPPLVVDAATQQYEGYLAAQATLARARGLGEDEDDMAGVLAEVLRRASEAERDLVLDARRRGDASAAAADEVLQDIEARAVRDLD